MEDMALEMWRGVGLGLSEHNCSMAELNVFLVLDFQVAFLGLQACQEWQVCQVSMRSSVIQKFLQPCR